MHCDICGEEVDNSEDLAKHMEKMHALAETGEPEEEENPKAPAEEEVPNSAPIIPGRM